MCDPEDPAVGNPTDVAVGVREPVDVYNTPVIIQSRINTQHKVAVWVERNIVDLPGGADESEGYYFVKVRSDDDPPSCIIHTDKTVYGSGVVSPTDNSGYDASSSSPVLLNGVDERSLFFPTLQGYANRYEIDSLAWPADPGGSVNHYSDQVTNPAHDIGTDTSGFVDPGQNLMFFGTRCAAQQDCDRGVDLGQLYLVDLSDPTSAAFLIKQPIEAWSFAAPVGLTNAAGTPTADDILLALGTYESSSSTAPFTGYNTNYDCALLLVSLDDSSGSWTISVDDVFYDDDADCEPADYTFAVDGFGGEPVPHANNELLALRHFGRLYNVRWHRFPKTFSSIWSLELEDTGAAGEVYQFQHPAEHSVVQANYPSTFNSVALWGANEYELLDTDGDGLYDLADFIRSAVIEVDLSEVSADGCTACSFDISTTSSFATLVGTFDDNGSNKPLIWGPGAAGHWYRASDPTEEYLVYAIATAARTTANPNPDGDEYCNVNDEPARLNLFYRQDAAGSSWQHDWIDLVDPSGTPKCYEKDLANPENFVPIEVPSGVTISGDSVYVATNDGRFWIYNTTVGLAAENSSNAYLLGGLAPGWPRYRKNNQGSGRFY